MQKPFSVAVLGGGSFGTAIANILAHNAYPVRLWLRDAQLAQHINTQHINTRYFPDIVLNEKIYACTDVAEAVTQADYIFVAIPSQYYRQLISQLKHLLKPNCALISLTKGIEAHSFNLMSQILEQELPGHSVGVLSGPNLAKEIIEKQLTATVMASEDKALVAQVQKMLHCSYFRVYAGGDRYGVELAGALKNCYAIMCGMAAAIGCGQNTIGMLITRSLAEMSRFAAHLGADPMTFIGLSGVGDLIVTCMSPLSRNYKVGFALGQGRALDEVLAELGQVAEGVNTLRYVQEKAQALGVYMPLINGMYEILFQQKDLASVVGKLMLAQQNTDVEFTLQSGNKHKN